MKITYTGRQVELAPAELKKLEARFAKIGKLLDGKRECEAHVVLSLERHLHHAEATVRYFNHQLVGLASSANLFEAIHAAAEKLEKQAVKTRTKWRDNRRVPRKAGAEAPPARRAAAEDFLRLLQRKGVPIRDFDRVLREKLLEGTDRQLAQDGKSAQQLYDALPVSDQAQVREFYF